MKDQDKTKEQLINELATIRRQGAGSKASNIDRKQIMENLLEKEGRFRTICEKAGAGIVASDIDGNFLEVNPAFCSFLGRSKDELLNLKVIDVTFPEDLAETRQQFEEIKAGLRQTIDLEKRYVRKDGAAVWGHVTAVCTSDSDLKPIYSIAIIQDITERKRTEQALQESEKHAKQLAQENSIMAELGRIISSTLKIEEVYKLFSEKVGKLIPFDRIGIGIISTEENTVSFPYIEGLSVSGRQPGDIVPLAGTAVEKVMQTRKSHLFQMENEEETAIEVPGLLPEFRAGIRSALTVPLVSRDQVIGMLSLRSATPGMYTDRDLKVAESIGSQIAGAIANAQLYGRLRETEGSLRRSEKKFRDLYDNAPVGYHELDTEGRITNVNRADLEMLGYSREEVIGEYIWKFNENEDIVRKSVLEKLSGLRPPGWSFERTYRRKDGATLPILLRDLLNRDEQGRITGIRVAVQDIIEQKRTEEALRESEQRFRTTFEKTGVGMVITDMEANFIEVNPAFCEFLGYDRDELLKMKVTDVTSLESLGETKKQFAEIVSKTRSAIDLEKRYIRKDGAIAWGHITSASVFNSESKPIYSVAVIQNITQHKQMEEALRRSEERFRDLYDSAPIGYHEVDMEGRIIIVNRMELEMLGQTAEELIGQYSWKLNIEEDSARERILAKLGGTVPPGQNVERTYRKKDGTPLPVLINDRLVFDEKGRIRGMYCTLQDITDRKKNEDALRQSNETLHRLIQVSPLAIVTLDSQKKVVMWNLAAERLFGWSEEEVLGRPVPTIPEEQKEGFNEMFEKELKGKKLTDVNLRRLRKDGSLVDVSLWTEPLPGPKGEVIGALGIFVDMSERKQAEAEKAILQEQLHQAQKMEAIGTLAGGIAHDFNNILSAILGYAELATIDLEEGSRPRKNLEQSMKAGHRAKDLVRQILAFSRQGKQERKVIDIKPIIKEGIRFLRASLPTTIEIRQSIDDDLGAIEADPTQVHQVLMNLCTNAAHAMEEKGGVLEVSLSKLDLDRENSASAGIERSPHVRLRVSDTGHGMPPEILKRIFDPYFTTKEVGKGTGLGLAVVHGIVKSYGGGIAIASEVGKGSTFDIYFPRIEGPSEPSRAIMTEPLSLGQYERVLLVDDEEPIVEVCREILEHLGYEVATRTSSIEALELFRVRAEQFDLVITDMTMPNMTGDKLAQELLRIRPDIPIILCTGFSEHITPEKAMAMGIKELVMKPFVMKELAKAMRRALGYEKQ